MFAPVTHALVEDGLIGRRQAVLDIATGSGEPALDVAALVGPDGKVVGIDLVPEMVAAARRASDRLAFRNTQFEVSLADHLPSAAETFDAVISRFGVMFFPSLVETVREIYKRQSQWKTSAPRDARCLKSFAKRSPRFQRSN
jgi:ubiquinone/menaquinone biosynthesis C-methylase UbiE